MKKAINDKIFDRLLEEELDRVVGGGNFTKRFASGGGNFTKRFASEENGYIPRPFMRVCSKCKYTWCTYDAYEPCPSCGHHK